MKCARAAPAGPRLVPGRRAGPPPASGSRFEARARGSTACDAVFRRRHRRRFRRRVVWSIGLTTCRTASRLSHRRSGAAATGAGCRGNRREQLLQRRAVAEFDAARILALAGRDRAGMRIFGCRVARRALPMISAGRPQQPCHRHASLTALHERRVRAVLQQPAHQIGQQIAMAADRRIDAAGKLAAILAIARTAPRPCRAGAETRTPCRPPSRRTARPSARCAWRIADRGAAAAPIASARRRGSSGRSSPCG